MKRWIVMAVCACALNQGLATDILTGNEPTTPIDTSRVVDIEEVVVIATPKENARLRQQTLSSTSFSHTDLIETGVTSIKSLSAQVPNLFIPNYGSKLTTSAYIRGVGSRTNTPAIGLYVDNIPYLDKSSFDFNFSDIERVDVLRGPQGTLYGHNTMGGLIRLYTKSPFTYRGTDLRLSAATYGYYKASLTHYHRISDQFAFSGGFFYDHQGGFFKNAAKNNKRVDKGDEYGVRVRAIYLPTDKTTLDFSARYEYLDQGAYPYQYMGVVSGQEINADLIGKVAYGSEGGYKRHLLTAGLNLEHQANRFIFSSVTGFQYLNDDMRMDQDYSPQDIFTLRQKQNSKSLTQEFVFKSKPNRRWEWTTGLSGFYQWQRTNAPVTFLSSGIQSMIEDNVNSVFTGLQATNPNMPDMSLDITDNSFVIHGRFKTPTANAALFHQSTFNNFLVKRLSLTLGARVEYEKVWIDYNSGTSLNFDFNIPMLEHMPSMASIAQQLKGMQIAPLYIGKLSHGNWEFLPKAALKYDFDPQNNVFVSVAKGYRSGGYNVQMFSDLIESRMSSDMMSVIDEKSGGMVSQMAGSSMTTGGTTDVNAAVYYRPERSWNWELGAHLGTRGGRLQATIAAFLMNTTNQQIARFSDNGLGRITVNAGKSRSYGVEASMNLVAGAGFSFNGNYGYTHATFRDYPVSADENYKGNVVPFVPRHTMTLGGQKVFYMRRGAWLDTITLHADYRAAGRIYWNEENTASQSVYGTLNGRIGLQKGDLELDFWANNIFNKDYDAFYFESLSKAYRQRGNPFQAGIDFRSRF